MRKPADYTLYKYRYVLSYFCIAVILVAVLWIGVLYTPGGLREQEIKSVSQASMLSRQTLEPSMVVNLPYYLLQRLSIFVFGVSEFSIKLPSIALGTLTMLGIFMLIRAWFKPNVAVISTIVLATSTHFLFQAQDGTPGITFSAVAVWLMVAGMYVTRGKHFHTFWKVLGGVLMSVALYLPMGVYLDLIIIIVALVHPHIRAIIKRLSKKKLFIALLVGLAAMAPLVYALILEPKGISKILLGLPPDFAHIKTNALLSSLSLFGFAATDSAADGLLRPAYAMPLTAIALLGFCRLAATHYTARSYVTILMSLVMVPLALLNYNNQYVIFVLMVIAVATGFDFLIRYWYRLFPCNPYARVAGLLPLSVLVSGLIYISVNQYFNGYTYNPAVVRAYNSDLSLVNAQLQRQKNMTLLADVGEIPIYNLAAHYNKSLTVATELDPEATQAVATRAARRKIPKDWQLESIITNARAQNGDRLYVYKKLP